MLFKVYLILYKRKMQFSVNAKNEKDARSKVLDKIKNAVTFVEIKDMAECEAEATVAKLKSMFGMFD